MSDQARVRHPLYGFLPADVDGFDSMVELALDMRWSWNHATDEVWRQLDPVLWDLTHHPCDVLTVFPGHCKKPALSCRKNDACVIHETR